MASQMGTRIEDPETQLIAIKDLEEVWEDAMECTEEVQAKRKVEFDWKLLKEHRIQVDGLVLLYDNRHNEFLGKLHT